METMIGRCEYCGAEQTVIAESQEDADRQVMESCGCPGAEIGEKKKKLQRTLDEVAGEFAPDNGFNALKPEVFAAIMTIGGYTVEGKVSKATFKVDGTNITIANNNGKVSAYRTVTHKQGGSIEQ